MQPEMIADYACACGEGPLWHPQEKRLYWVDIPTGRMFRYSPQTGRHEQCYSGAQVGGFTLQEDGALLLFMAKGAVAVWRDGKLETVIEEIPDERETRFNDVIADPAGRVFCGTMPTRQRKGRLYRLDPDGTLTRLLDGIGCSNGMGFTPDRRRMYFTDSGPREIYLFDYDEDTGAIANQRVFVQTPAGQGVPDGMTVDAEGYVWSARWDGGCLVRYAPDGTEERRVAFPAPKVSCPTFGGDDCTDIYVTTAGGNHKDRPSTSLRAVSLSNGEGPGAGALYRVNLGIRGVPEFRSRIRLQ